MQRKWREKKILVVPFFPVFGFPHAASSQRFGIMRLSSTPLVLTLVWAALAASAHVVEGSIITAFVEHAYIEPEAGAAWLHRAMPASASAAGASLSGARA